MQRELIHCLDQVRHIETLALRAFPAAEVGTLDGWRLRFTDRRQATRRCNSVWPNEDAGALTVEEKIAAAEAFYRERGCPARFQVCPAAVPADLDGRLEARGYCLEAVTCVQTARIAVMETGVNVHPVEISEALTRRWFEALCEESRLDEVNAGALRGVLERIRTPCAFAAIRSAGRIAALGMAVLEGEWAGIFDMRTTPAFRRQGGASAILQALASWADARGAHSAYLQVVAENEPAMALYHEAGFRTLYRYHYRRFGF